MVGAGAVVTRDVPARAIVVGIRRYVRGYVDDCGRTRDGAETATVAYKSGSGKRAPNGDPIARRIALARELPGGAIDVLAAAGVGSSRAFELRGVHRRAPRCGRAILSCSAFRTGRVRGEHAHRDAAPVSGVCARKLLGAVFDGERGTEVALDRPDLGLHVPPMVWTTQYKYSADAVLVVLASDVYREDDYIRDLDRYQERRMGTKESGVRSRKKEVRSQKSEFRMNRGEARIGARGPVFQDRACRKRKSAGKEVARAWFVGRDRRSGDFGSDKSKVRRRVLKRGWARGAVRMVGGAIPRRRDGRVRRARGDWARGHSNARDFSRARTARIGEHVVLGRSGCGRPGAAILLAARNEDSWISVGAGSRLANGVEMIALERIELGERTLAGGGSADHRQ